MSKWMMRWNLNGNEYFELYEHWSILQMKYHSIVMNGATDILVMGI